jgi:hypothetical protein
MITFYSKIIGPFSDDTFYIFKWISDRIRIYALINYVQIENIFKGLSLLYFDDKIIFLMLQRLLLLFGKVWIAFKENCEKQSWISDDTDF